MDGEIKEIVSGILENSSYSNSDKKQLLAYYSEMLGAGDKISALAKKSGFNFVANPPKEESQETPPTQGR